jgi:hypothetical protein
MKTTKITPFVNDRLRGFEEGEINILLGDDAADNLHYSLMQSVHLVASGKFNRIVYLNFPFSKRKFTAAREAVLGEHREQIEKKIGYYHLASGRTSEKLHILKSQIDDPEQTAIVINAWELASSNYRYREELIFALRELQMELGMTVFVFSMAKPAAVTARRLNRAGLGKLTLAAERVISLIEEKQPEQINVTNEPPKQRPYSDIAYMNEEEAEAFTNSRRKQPKDDLDARIEANRKKTLAELPAIREEAKRTGKLRLTVDQILGLDEDEYESLQDEYGKIETIREPKKQKSVSLSVPDFNNLAHADGHLSQVEEEELEYA